MMGRIQGLPRIPFLTLRGELKKNHTYTYTAVGRVPRWPPRFLPVGICGLQNPLPLSVGRACKYDRMLLVIMLCGRGDFVDVRPLIS